MSQDFNPPSIPDCRHGHGRMSQAPGAFVLQGVNIKPGVPAGLLSTYKTIFEPRGEAYAVLVYRCATCGYVELQDPPNGLGN